MSDQTDELLIGVDWLRANKCVLSFENFTLTLHGRNVPLLKKAVTNTCHRIISEETVELPAGSETVVPGRMVYSNLRKRPPGVAVTETKECHPGLKTARCLIDIGTGMNLPVRLINTNNTSVSLVEGSSLCSLDEIESVVEEVEPPEPPVALSHSTPPEPPEPPEQPMASKPPKYINPRIIDSVKRDLIQKLIAAVPAEVSAEHTARLEQLLHQYEDILSRDEFDMGLTDLVQHEIDTGQEKPVRQSLRKTPLAYNEVIDKHVQSMLKQGLIEPSSSDWASNIVLVLKKDKSFRFRIDFRGLNLKTRKDIYPIPRIDASLDALAGSSWFFTLDLRSGYFQVPLKPEDAYKTAFVVRGGSYKWKVLPMGLCNSASTFQRLMNMVLSGLNYTSCLVYLDDIIIMSRSLDEHLSRLEEVFQRIREAKLKLRPDKCVVLQRQVTFLGHVVSADGITMDPKKLEVVQKWGIPRNLKEVRAYVGFVSYYRRYIKDFSTTARALHALTRKNVKFEWTQECQEAFDTLKQKLTSALIVALPRDEGEYRLDTDASGWAIGAVLSQVQDGHERVISYASRLYSPSERNYCTTRQKLLAVVFFTK